MNKTLAAFAILFLLELKQQPNKNDRKIVDMITPKRRPYSKYFKHSRRSSLRMRGLF